MAGGGRGSRRSSREEPAAGAAPPEDANDGRVAAHVRERQRAVAEREASRLARPEPARKRVKLGHADPKKSAVLSTPAGFMLQKKSENDGQEVEEWCGPWSVARQMIAKREEARRLREEEDQKEPAHPLDAAFEQLEKEKYRKNHPSMSWKGQVGESDGPSSLYAKRKRRVQMNVKGGGKMVPSLVQMCVNFVVENFEHVESLGDVDNDIRVLLSKELVARNALDAEALATLAETPGMNMETLELIDCAGIPQDAFVKTIEKLPRLRYLLMTHAGRCLGQDAVKALLKLKPELQCLSVSGAYVFSDQDAASLLDSVSSTISSLSLHTCPLLGIKTVGALTCQPMAGNLLELSLQDMTWNPEVWLKFTESSDALGNLQSLTLRGMGGLTDDIAIGFLESIHKGGNGLAALDLSDNDDLTDKCLSGIRQFSSSSLKSLNLRGLRNLTSMGLELFFAFEIEEDEEVDPEEKNEDEEEKDKEERAREAEEKSAAKAAKAAILATMPPPPKLKVLDLGSVDHQAVTDDVLALVTSSAAIAKPGNAKGSAMNTGLVRLNIQGSTLVSDHALEHLAVTSASTLSYLNVSYCPLVTTKGLGYLVSQCGPQLRTIEVWGCAHLTDEFFDGHARAQEGTLEVVGAWMKRSGTRTVR